jgi:hypothetical protein
MGFRFLALMLDSFSGFLKTSSLYRAKKPPNQGTRSSRVSNSRESVTVVVCVNASGGTMSPQIILIAKGKTEKALNGFNKTEGPENAEGLD